MIPKPFDQIEQADIQAIISNSVAEGRTLEFKEQLPGGADRDKKEFLADVSSFANAAGGDLIYGVSAADGIAVAAPGLSGLNGDAEILRLEEMIRGGIDPRISGIQLRTINGFAAGPILVLRIPKSWASPHMVTLQNTARFFARSNAGKFQMDVAEIRAAFALSESLPERIRSFQRERLSKVVANEGSVPLIGEAKIVLHILPIQAFTERPIVQVPRMVVAPTKLPPLWHGDSFRHRINLDGIVTFAGADGEFYSYTQLFRTRAIEAVDSVMLNNDPHGKTIPGRLIEEELLSVIPQYLSQLRELEVSPPVFVFLTLAGVRGFSMAVARRTPLTPRDKVDRDMLLLPEVVLEDLNGDITGTMQPVFDCLWQAAGFRGSPNFDASGNWTPQSQ